MELIEHQQTIKKIKKIRNQTRKQTALFFFLLVSSSSPAKLQH